MLKNLLGEQRQSVENYFNELSVEGAQKIFDACMNCTGLIVFTGVGKSGIIAEKIAMTFISTGTKALYLPPTNFLHGDIGILSSNDLLVLLSKSGETEELIQLLPFARRRGVRLAALVSNPNGRLAKACDLSIVLPVDKELCPFDLAPTTSTCVQLLFGDLLAAALMRAKKFSLDEYAQNHPLGTIGKKMSVKVEELMIQGHELPLCRPTDRMSDVLAELSNKRLGCLIVTDEERRLLGIFTDGDLRRSLQAHGSKMLEESIAKLMTTTPSFVDQSLLAWEALKQMQRNPKRWITALPVLNNGKVVGMIRMHDIVQAGLG